MADPKIILATRKSPLALVQAEMVAAWLQAKLGFETELLKIITTGDRRSEWSLEKKGGKGLFTGELEAALMRGEAAVAVHSTKDLPGAMSAGLALAGYLPRGDPRDVLVVRTGGAIPKKIATGSPRRRRQAARQFPGAEFCEIRGNVVTRLRKIARDHVADGTILAAAGLQRLGITDWRGLEFHPFDFSQMVPAVGQGAIAVQCRTADALRFSPAFDAATARAVALERAFQAALGAGCHTAFGAHATADTLHFFHENTGGRMAPLHEGDFADPAATAHRLLREFGLLG